MPYGFSFSYSQTTVQSSINNLVQYKYSTATLLGLQTGVALTQSQDRNVTIPKIVLIITDGAANNPCDCCDCGNFSYW